MGLNIGKIASTALSIGSKIDVGKITSGMNINSLSAESLPGVSSSMAAKLDGIKNDITSQMSGTADQLDLESAVNTLDIEGKVNEMMASQGMDLNSLGMKEGQINAMITSTANEMISNIGLDSINYG